MLEVAGIDTFHGNIQALRGVSLSVAAGEIVSLIGSNGAGKTTTLMSISGVTPPRSGTIRFAGVDITRLPAEKIVAQGLTQVPEGRMIFPRLTVLENLMMGAYLRRDKTAVAGDIEHVYELFPVLLERRYQFGGTLSGGEQQMLAIGRALMSEPRMLLLDEPSLGLAPMIVNRVFDTVIQLNEETGLTILVVEQNAAMTLEICDRAYVLDTGRVTLEGEGAALLNDPRVQASYLGVSA